jgi:WD40 repeat protein
MALTRSIKFSARENSRRTLFRYPAVAVAVSWLAIFLGPCRAQEKKFSATTIGPIHFLAISPSSDLIAVDALQHPANCYAIALFSISSGKPVATFEYEPGGGAFGGLAFSRDGKSLISAGGDPKAAINHWDVESGKITKSWSGQGSGLLLTDRWLLTRDFPVCKTIWVYDLETQKEVAKLAGFASKVEMAAISADGKQIAVWEDGGGPLRPVDGPLKLWEVATGKQLRDWGKQKFCIDKMQFFRNEPTLAVVGGGGLWLYDLKTGKAPAFTCFRMEAISGDGKMMASRGVFTEYADEETTRYPDGMHIYSVGKKKVIATLPVDKDWKSGPVQFTPNNRFLVCAGAADGTVRIWDVSKLKP